MTMTRPRATTAAVTNELTHTARTAGLLYLAFFVAGIAGSIVVRSQIFASGDPETTLANLTEHASLARLGIVLELAIVVVQALTAVWLYRLFRGVNDFAATSLALFGMVNAVAILGSAALLATAVDVAGDTSLAAPGGAAATAQLLYVLSGHSWGVAATFFGLWLIPMGWLVIRSGWMPAALGWVLIAGGVGYLGNAVVTYAFAEADVAAQLLTLPSIVGEVWIMAYLVIFGVREHPQATEV